MAKYIFVRNTSRDRYELRKNDIGCALSVTFGFIAFLLCSLCCMTSHAQTYDVKDNTNDTIVIAIGEDSTCLSEPCRTNEEVINTCEPIIIERHIPDVYTVRDTVYELHYVPCGAEVITKEVPAALSKDQQLLIILGKYMLVVIGIFFLFLFCFFAGCIDISCKKPKKKVEHKQ